MSKVRFCIEEDNPYSLERLEKVLGRCFWYGDEKLRILLKEFIEFPDIENWTEPSEKLLTILLEFLEKLSQNLSQQLSQNLLKEFSKLKKKYCPEPLRISILEELLKVTPHTPVYDKGKMKNFKPNVLLITNEPGLMDDVLKNLYLEPAKDTARWIREDSRCICGYQKVLEEIIERFNDSMKSWLTLTPLSELKDKINGEREMDWEAIKNKTLINDLKICDLKKLSYWVTNKEREDDTLKIGVQCNNEWENFLEQEEPRVIHWDLLPYAQYGKEKNDINDKIRNLIKEVTGNNPSSQIFKDINEKIKSKASYKQSLWYVKLLDKFLEAFKEINIEEGKFFILVVGNRIIKRDENDNYEKDRREILGHLFAGLYKENPNIRNAIVIFRNKWCSCSKEAYLYFVKFDEFLDNNGNFSWTEFENVLRDMNQLTRSTFYGGKNQIPCY